MATTALSIRNRSKDKESRVKEKEKGTELKRKDDIFVGRLYGFNTSDTIQH